MIDDLDKKYPEWWLGTEKHINAQGVERCKEIVLVGDSSSAGMHRLLTAGGVAAVPAAGVQLVEPEPVAATILPWLDDKQPSFFCPGANCRVAGKVPADLSDDDNVACG